MNDIELFFSKTYEDSINQKMLYYKYVFQCEEVKGYVLKINSIEISDILTYITSNQEDVLISPRDIFQFSSINDATETICRKVKEANNEGYKFLELGKMLLDDGIIRKDGAYTKYGENHVKTAEMLGLMYELSHVYFLSCLGCIYNELDEENKNKLLVRLVLRNKFVGRLYRASLNGTIDLRNFLYMLSDTTYARRKSNIKSIINILKNCKEYDFSEFINMVKY